MKYERGSVGKESLYTVDIRSRIGCSNAKMSLLEGELQGVKY